MAVRPGIRGSWRVRQVATVVGAALVMVGAGLPWSIGGERISAFKLSLRWLVSPGAGTNADPVKSIGMLVLVLVGIIVFGLVTAVRSPTILGGVGAIVVAAAFGVSVSRSARGLVEAVGPGVYLVVAGGLTAVVGTLLGAGPRRR